MMGKTDNQMQLNVLDIDSMVPQNHLLRQIKKEPTSGFLYGTIDLIEICV